MGRFSSLLVSCPGAYANSGAGTGGLVCLHDGEATVVDRMDSMGLAGHRGNVYRFVRSMHMIIGYDQSGLRSIINLPEARDIHDILVDDKQIVAVSTGENDVLWLDHLGNLVDKWHGEGEGDAWHLNCLATRDGRMYVSAFGEFPTHRAWSGNARNQGFVMDLETKEKILTGLSAPHTPRYVGEDLYICESHKQMVTVRDKRGNVREHKFDGFTRGFAWDDKYFYVGESADRKAEVVLDYSHVTVVDRETFATVERFRVPFTEIYDLLIIEPALAAHMASAPDAFALGLEDERIDRLEKSLQINSEMVAGLRAQLREAHKPGYLFARLGRFLRRLHADAGNRKS